jgi:hypothetical protein
MVQILQAGTGAQEVLLRHVRDQTIQFDAAGRHWQRKGDLAHH